MTTTKYLLSTQPKNLVFEVLDVYQDASGRKMLCVRAIDEKPFIGGDKWPIRSEFGTCELVETDCNCVLPGQSCPACREVARRVYREEIPFE